MGQTGIIDSKTSAPVIYQKALHLHFAQIWEGVSVKHPHTLTIYNREMIKTIDNTALFCQVERVDERNWMAH